MKRWVHASQNIKASVDAATIQELIRMNNGTKKRQESLNAIEEWNVDPEDATVLVSQLRFKGDDYIVAVDYADDTQLRKASAKGATDCFVFTHADGRRSLWGHRTDDNRSLYYFGRA